MEENPALMSSLGVGGAMLNLYLIMPVDPAYEDLEIKRPEKSIK